MNEIIYPILYDSKESNFNSNGLGFLSECTSAFVIEERNGIFELELDYPVGSFLYSELKKGNLIKCHASDNLKNQLFRIYHLNKKHNNIISVYARHISFDLHYDIVEKINLPLASCEYALNEIFRQSVFCKDYRGYSNIEMAHDFDLEYVSCLSAIAGTKGSIIDIYGTGSEILRDNKNIHILKNRGLDNSVLIAYRKNITGLEVDEDNSDLITSIYPYVIATNDNEEDVIIVLPEKFVNSSKFNDYQHPYIKFIDFTNDFNDTEEITEERLRYLASDYFKRTKCDIPKFTYKIEFIPLSKTVNYKEYKFLEAVNLCDKVLIRDTRYNIDTQAKVIKIKYNVLLSKIEELTLGDPKTNISDIVGGSSGNDTGTPPSTGGNNGNEDIIVDDTSFPDILPNVPVLTANGLFATVQLDWTYENKIYYHYEVYASKTKDFIPSDLDLIFRGRSSAFLHEVKPKEIWYYRVRVGNTHSNYTDFSEQVFTETSKMSNAATYIEEASIEDALIKELRLDRGWVGQLTGNWIDARQLTVTDGNGKRTLSIDSFGNVFMDVTELKISSSDVATKTEVSESIANIQIGGTNLHYNTDFAKELNTNWKGLYNTVEINYIAEDGAIEIVNVSGATNRIGTRVIGKSCEDLYLGNEYKITFESKGVEGLTRLDYNYFMANITGVVNQNIGSFELTDTFRKYEVTFIPNKDYTNGSLMLAVNSCPEGQGFAFRKVQIELGNKATDWKPSPVDTNSQIEQKANTVDVYSKIEVFTKEETTSEIEVATDSITSSVSELQTIEISNRKVGSFKYVRDWLNGNSVNTGNHWVELKVMVGDTNIAEGITPTSIIPMTSLDKLTDGNIASNSYISGGSGLQWVQIDLGSIREDVDFVHVWHFYNDNRSYNHRLEVSRDGITWFILYDSNKSGKYIETSEGRVHIINETKTESRLKSAEQKITPDAIINTVSEQLSSDGTIQTSIMKFDKNGIEVSHTEVDTVTIMNSKGFFIFNSQGETVGSLATETGLSVVSANKIYADNIQNIYEGDSNLYINHDYVGESDGSSANPFKSYEEFKEYIYKTPIINKPLNIYIVSTSEITESFLLRGLEGSGYLTFNYAKHCIHRNVGWNIDFSNVKNQIQIFGNRSNYNTADGAIFLDTGTGHGMRFVNCGHIQVNGLAINVKNWGIFSESSNGRTRRVDFCTTYCAIDLNESAVWYDGDSCGNCTDFCRINSGSVFQYGNSSPGGFKPHGRLLETTGKYFLVGSDRAATNSFRSPPPKPQYSDQYISCGVRDYGYFTYGRNGINVNSWNPAGKRIQQGEWGGYGNNYGFVFLDDTSVRNWLSNGTPKDGSTLTLKRASSGGYSSSQPIYLYGSLTTGASGTPTGLKSYGNIGSLAWSEQKTFNIPTSFVNDLKTGSIKSICFFDSTGASYVKIDAASLRLKASKPV